MRHLPFILLLALAACRLPGPRPPAEGPGPTHPPQAGVLVMAHGGSPEWNASVSEAAAALREALPTAVAFGMADPATLEAGLDSLRTRGVERVAVVRLFLSGRSFRAQTEYLLGLSATPPPSFVSMAHHGAGDGSEEAGSHPGVRHPSSGTNPGPAPIRHGLRVATHADGLLLSPQARRIAAARALALSRNAQEESVLFLAHGMGDDEENMQVLRAMEGVRTDPALDSFAVVRTATLREDWPEKRAAEEHRIRGWVAVQRRAGRRVLVVPMRLSGFGPYAEVLDGLSYVPGEGLLPHPEIATWIGATAHRVLCAEGWASPLGSCTDAG